MGAYILRRLALVIPTLLGIMLINFSLVQFVPGGPIEQIIAEMEGGGDVFEGIAGGGSAETAGASGMERLRSSNRIGRIAERCPAGRRCCKS